MHTYIDTKHYSTKTKNEQRKLIYLNDIYLQI